MNQKTKDVIIVPHTHWDREWYLPFQKFRFKLVELIDDLLEILAEENYKFMLDGQTIVLEDYFEIRPEKKDSLLQHIRKGNISVGPWYLLPDEWLVGQESLIRNLEFGLELCKAYNIRAMNIAYLPDMFGHSRAIPQLIDNLTDFKATVVWRGVDPSITDVPFKWKSHKNAKESILAVYLPFGYGNAAALPMNVDGLEREIKRLIKQLEPYSPVSVYLLQNGTDHQLPRKELVNLLPKINIENSNIRVGLLPDFLELLVESVEAKIKEESNIWQLQEHIGEFRSSARAHLLQDTYSTRMWIKQWNQKLEDLLVRYSEPISTYLFKIFRKTYPKRFLEVAWKWLLKNHPHDSICGCSVDEVHEEMKARFLWTQSITEAILDDNRQFLRDLSGGTNYQGLLIFNPTNNSSILMKVDFTVPKKLQVFGLQNSTGERYEVQSSSKETAEIIFDNAITAEELLNFMYMFNERKIMDFYVNDSALSDIVNDECTLKLYVDEREFGDYDVEKLKSELKKRIEANKDLKFHVKVMTGSENTYSAMIKVPAWSFTNFNLITDKNVMSSSRDDSSSKYLKYSTDVIENSFYRVEFTDKGRFNLINKRTQENFEELHEFEDWGDRGDEYTFGRVAPEFVRVKDVKRTLSVRGNLFCEITQKMTLILYERLSEDRTERINQVKMPVVSKFKFYKDIDRIDIRTSLTNKTKDHRLRICFNLPYKSATTKTSTHFGYVNRLAQPKGDESYVEQPSGIQPQKRFITVSKNTFKTNFTLINKGLPEIELVNEKKLALTLVRSIGYLSRSDIPERPMHAGPFLATPGAQQLNKEYTFEYSIVVNVEDMVESNNHSEAANLPLFSILTPKNIEKQKLLPILNISDKYILISSLRVRNSKIVVTLYNFDTHSVHTQLRFTESTKTVKECKLIDKVLKTISVEDNTLDLTFNPLEIKMLVF